MSEKMFFLIMRKEMLRYRNDGYYTADENLKCSFCGGKILAGERYYFVANNTHLELSDERLGVGMVPGNYCCDSHAGHKSWNRMKWRFRKSSRIFRATEF